MAATVMNLVFVVFSIFVVIHAESCQNPQVNSNVYTTTDGTVVTSVGFIAEFSVSCSNNIKHMNLYAQVAGKIMPATKSVDGNLYQVSWTSDPKDVNQYNYPIKVYDEDGYTSLRKLQRSGDDVTSIPPLLTLDVRHHGTYLGPWLQSELVAAAVAIAVWYFAFSTKKQLIS